MSYDWHMAPDTGGPASSLDGCDLNCTYNVGRMFLEAMGGSWYDDFNGRTGAKMQPVLERAITDMVKRRDHYEDMNPSNGWGSYTGALSTLRMLRDWCELYPKARLVVT